jgi:hypothetical protein
VALVPASPIPDDALSTHCDGTNYTVYMPGDEAALAEWQAALATQLAAQAASAPVDPQAALFQQFQQWLATQQ